MLTSCPKCGCTKNESKGNDFHCFDCPYIECGDESRDAIRDDWKRGMAWVGLALLGMVMIGLLFMI